jgi:hypothetical protein
MSSTRTFPSKDCSKGKSRKPLFRRLAENEVSQQRFLEGWLEREEKLKTASGLS